MDNIYECSVLEQILTTASNLPRRPYIIATLCTATMQGVPLHQLLFHHQMRYRWFTKNHDQMIYISPPSLPLPLPPSLPPPPSPSEWSHATLRPSLCLAFFIGHYGNRSTSSKRLECKSLLMSCVGSHVSFSLDSGYYSEVDPVVEQLVQWLPYLLEHLDAFINRFHTQTVSLGEQ